MSLTHQSLSILLVDDDPQSLASTEKILIRSGEKVVTAQNGQEALEIIQSKRHEISLVVTDVRMPKMSGIEFLKALNYCGSDLPVILMTAYGQIQEAVWAMKFGALDFLTKPFKREALIQAVKNAKSHNRQSTIQYPTQQPLNGEWSWVYQSLEMQSLMQQANKVAATGSTVLIEGETGTGKEMLAQLIHQRSPRAQGPFTALNCAAIPENLLESELFGYERGAFTGAGQSKDGLFESTHGGTLFLDEIGDMPLSLQVKLLRVLQSGEVRRIGSSSTTLVDVRIVSATHKNLRQLVNTQSFREDLLFRLDVVKLTLPPLRSRPGDIKPLLQHYLEKFSVRHNKKLSAVTDEFWQCFSTYAWPGNIRELMNVLERAVIFSEADRLTLKDLPEHMQATLADGTQSKKWGKNEVLEIPLGVTLKEVEDLIIQRTLAATDGDKNIAAKILGINSRTIHRRTRINDGQSESE